MNKFDENPLLCSITDFQDNLKNDDVENCNRLFKVIHSREYHVYFYRRIWSDLNYNIKLG
jgi:hypothetical protein